MTLIKDTNKKIVIICEKCGKKRTVYKSTLKQKKWKYCSRNCYLSSIRIKKKKKLGMGLTPEIENKKERPNYFHNPKFGCKLINKSLKNKASKYSKGIPAGYCQTHEVDICRCGWEWGHHPMYNSSNIAYSDKNIEYNG